VNQVQIGSQGSQVMIVQDSLNRLQGDEPGAAFTSIPLNVDGQFGPKTHARVQEFQGKSSLKPDGVVGPMTRGALQAQALRSQTA